MTHCCSIWKKKSQSDKGAQSGSDLHYQDNFLNWRAFKNVHLNIRMCLFYWQMSSPASPEVSIDVFLSQSVRTTDPLTVSPWLARQRGLHRKLLMWPLTSGCNPHNDDRGTSHAISHCISLPAEGGGCRAEERDRKNKRKRGRAAWREE